jgi:hypothetical protein
MEALRASTALSPDVSNDHRRDVGGDQADGGLRFEPKRERIRLRARGKKKGRRKAASIELFRTARAQSELQTLVVFIEFSASVRVLNAVLPMTVVVVVVGFVVTIEQCLVEESCTTQYSSASAGVANTVRAKAQMIALFIASSRSSSRCRTSSCRLKFRVGGGICVMARASARTTGVRCVSSAGLETGAAGQD